MTSSRFRLLFASALSLIVAGAAHAAPAAPDYVKQAGASDLFELKSSKLVLASTKNADVRKFAHEMVTDHTQSTAQVKAAATKSGLHPKPPVLDADQAQMIAQLTAAKGPARDKAYVDQQKTSHQAALQLQQGYADGGDKPALKATAAKIVPVVQHHIEMLNGMLI